VCCKLCEAGHYRWQWTQSHGRRLTTAEVWTGCQNSRRFQGDIWHMNMVRLSAIRPGSFYPFPSPPGNTPGTHLCSRLSRLQGHIVAGRIMPMKNFRDTIGNLTRNLSTYSACLNQPYQRVPPKLTTPRRICNIFSVITKCIQRFARFETWNSK
jgi:hypothetical protein